MTEYSFQEGIPEGYTPDYESGIFHDPRHLQLQSTTGWQSFSLINNQERTIAGLIHIHVEKDCAESPFRSTYGSYLISKKVSPSEMMEFVKNVENELKSMGVQSLLLKHAPEGYAKDESQQIRKALLKNGYQVEREETSSIISISEQSYEALLHRTKKSRLKKCYEKGFQFHQLSKDQLNKIYEFLKECREEKGYSLSMSLPELKKVVEAFPDQFFFHAVVDKSEFVAASISIQVLPTVLYTFYYDHQEKYDQISPVVFLCEGLYGFCRQRAIYLIDLGASHVDGKQVESLLNFKRSLGGQPSPKLTFYKTFS